VRRHAHELGIAIISSCLTLLKSGDR